MGTTEEKSNECKPLRKMNSLRNETSNEGGEDTSLWEDMKVEADERL